VEQYIKLFSSIQRIPIILFDNIILGNCCFWILAKQISCRLLSGAWLSRLSHVCQTGTTFDSGTHSTELEAQLHKQYNYVLLEKFCQSELSSTHQCTHYPKDEWSVDRQHFFVIFQPHS
jgi:hypothetical protein